MALFGAEERGGVALESAIALSVVVVALAAVVEIVNTVYESDRMARAARAVARTAAVEATLDAGASACAAIRGELRLADDFDCGGWQISVDRGVLPSELAGALGSTAPAGTGDLILVRIAWTRGVVPVPEVVPAANAAGDGSAAGAGLLRLVAIGVARGEPTG